MDDLPPEIWALIARYLPRETLISMMLVNRTFYTMALDDIYQKLVMDHIDETFIRTLEALKCVIIRVVS